MAEVDERILNKIKKCLALAQSNEPNEAAAAMRQAQKMMDAHGVSQLQLRRSDIGEAQVKSKASVSKPKDWETNLLATVGKAFGCKLMWISSHSSRAGLGDAVYGTFIYIGLKTQVELAQYTAEVMTRKLIKARSQFVSHLVGSRAGKVREADGFCHGWVLAVAKTIHAFALTKETEELIDEVKHEITQGRKEDPQQRKAGSLGLQHGMLAGQGESIHQPVGERDNLRISCK